MLAAAVNGIPIFFGGFYLCVQTLNFGAESSFKGQSLHLGSHPDVSFPFITYWLFVRSRFLILLAL